MPTQYDDIAATYEEMKALPYVILLDANVKAAVAPFVKGAKVLDLACGTGYWSKKFVEWGAKQVVGVDISKGMIDTANAAATNLDRLSFHIGDCSVPVRYTDGPFDMVFGAWLLNYASDGKELVGMFRNISMNLRSNGQFIGVAPPPTNNPREHCERASAVQPAQYGGLVINITKDVEEGIATHLVAPVKSGTVEFDNYHLRKSLYEKSAREGGLEGPFLWRPTDSPDIDKDILESIHSPSWEDYLAVPSFSTLVIAKS